MRTLIIDDDNNSHVTLKSIIQKRHAEINLIGAGYSVSEGKNLVLQHDPELVFLDIELPDGLGFDLLKTIPQPKFHVIFVTGFHQYAQTAIRLGALDYLTKPVSEAELSAAILKAQIRKFERIQLEQFKIIQDVLKKLEYSEMPKRMSIPTSEGVIFFPTEKVIRLEAMQNLTEFFLENDDRRLIASCHLKKYELDLKPFNLFMRVHKSHLINLMQVTRFIKGEKAFLEMTDQSIVPISKKYRKELGKRLEEL